MILEADCECNLTIGLKTQMMAKQRGEEDMKAS